MQALCLPEWRTPEILVRGHSAFSAIRVQKMLSRGEFSKYLFSPTKYNFKQVVRITAQVLKYLKLKKLNPVIPLKTTFKMFVVTKDDEEKPNLEEIKLAGYFSTVTMNKNDDEVCEKESVEEMFALSAEIKPRLKCRRSFREDLEVSKKF